MKMLKIPVIGQKIARNTLKDKSFAPAIQVKPSMPIFSSIPSDDEECPVCPQRRLH